MAKKTNFSLTILSAILGITVIACLVILYNNGSLASQHIESIYIVTLISIIGLISIHVRLLFKDITLIYIGEKKESEISGVAKVLSNHKISTGILRSNKNTSRSKHLDSRPETGSNKAFWRKGFKNYGFYFVGDPDGPPNLLRSDFCEKYFFECLKVVFQRKNHETSFASLFAWGPGPQ